MFQSASGIAFGGFLRDKFLSLLNLPKATTPNHYANVVFHNEIQSNWQS